MNSLVDPSTIRALYAASQAGVEIDLLVRGICCLRAGRAGAVGAHPRHQRRRSLPRAQPRVRLRPARVAPRSSSSSADWMPRNFVRRIEVMCPIEDPALKQRLLDEVLGTALRDNVKARALQPDGHYERVVRPGPLRALAADAARQRARDGGGGAKPERSSADVPQRQLNPRARFSNTLQHRRNRSLPSRAEIVTGDRVPCAAGRAPSPRPARAAESRDSARRSCRATAPGRDRRPATPGSCARR